MRRAYVPFTLLLSMVLLFLLPACAHAATLKLAPLDYKMTLSAGESKKGFIDITNPSTATEHVAVKVMAFRQVDDYGAIQFYANDQVAAGIRVDYNEADIGPRETLHLAFGVDGSKLPSGNVFAAILATTTATNTSSVTTAAQVGTLLSITNGTPTSQTAEVVALQAPWLQIGDKIGATIAVKNTADPTNATGFYPQLTVATSPYGQTVSGGPLVFAGRTRNIAYQVPGNYFGLVWLNAGVGQSSKGQLIFAVTGYWRWLAPLIVVGIVVVIIATGRLRRLLKHL